MPLLAGPLPQNAAFTPRLSLTANLGDLKHLLPFFISSTVTYSILKVNAKTTLYINGKLGGDMVKFK